MNRTILTKEIQDFINVNLRIDINSLLLKSAIFESVTNKELAEQISARKKAKDKLPTWFGCENSYYPSKISVEQTSSEQTAAYKASLVQGKKLIDITGGFGVDDFYFSKQFDSIIHCEMNEELSAIAAHNFEQLGIENCQFFVGDGMRFLEESEEQFDWIYLDPSRRNETKGKVFLMADCLPDVPNNLDVLFSKSEQILMKTSPLIDLSQGLKELEGVKEIQIIAVKNEVKELLWILDKSWEKEVTITAVNLLPNRAELFSFLLPEEFLVEANYALPSGFLYEPNSAIMKSGGFNQVGHQFNLRKLHAHSHLYTSDTLIEFPGRIFKIKEVLEYNSKKLKKEFGGKKANITTRNFPVKVEELRKKLKIKDGGEVYLFFTTNRENKKQVLVCEKIS